MTAFFALNNPGGGFFASLSLGHFAALRTAASALTPTFSPQAGEGEEALNANALPQANHFAGTRLAASTMRLSA
jgi:hypothetical protein